MAILLLFSVFNVKNVLIDSPLSKPSWLCRLCVFSFFLKFLLLSFREKSRNQQPRCNIDPGFYCMRSSSSFHCIWSLMLFQKQKAKLKAARADYYLIFALIYNIAKLMTIGSDLPRFLFIPACVFTVSTIRL